MRYSSFSTSRPGADIDISETQETNIRENFSNRHPELIHRNTLFDNLQSLDFEDVSEYQDTIGNKIFVPFLHHSHFAHTNVTI